MQEPNANVFALQWNIGLYIAYIPLRRKTIRIGYWRWLGHTFALPNAKDTNMLVSFAFCDANFSRHPTQNPNASQWNIGCIGFQPQNFCVDHVHFICFWWLMQTQFPVEYGLKCMGSYPFFDNIKYIIF